MNLTKIISDTLDVLLKDGFKDTAIVDADTYMKWYEDEETKEEFTERSSKYCEFYIYPEESEGEYNTFDSDSYSRDMVSHLNQILNNPNDDAILSRPDVSINVFCDNTIHDGYQFVAKIVKGT